jgi:hypothetical protein
VPVVGASVRPDGAALDEFEADELRSTVARRLLGRIADALPRDERAAFVEQRRRVLDEARRARPRPGP